MEKSTEGTQHTPVDANVNQGRMKTGLGFLDMEVASATTTLKFCPNTILMAAMEDKLTAGEPVYPSFLSGEPGFLYRNDELQIAFTGEELRRFVSHDLHPEEFFKLYGALGESHEIHGDFYDLDTGEALQPLD